MAPVNVIKFKINYSRFFLRDLEKTEYVLKLFLRDLEKTEYVLKLCQFRWKKSNHFAKSQLKSKISQFPMQVKFVIDYK